ncbi:MULTISPECIES: Rv3235 family protein [unclassified Streptomyces]|uniref:Rv3235 family protein n=1 Tax=unclassified Streptomyces TaxID=2593676 RepID=UPI00381944CF
MNKVMTRTQPAPGTRPPARRDTRRPAGTPPRAPSGGAPRTASGGGRPPGSPGTTRPARTRPSDNRPPTGSGTTPAAAPARTAPPAPVASGRPATPGPAPRVPEQSPRHPHRPLGPPAPDGQLLPQPRLPQPGPPQPGLPQSGLPQPGGPRPTDLFADRLLAVLSGRRPVHSMLRHTVGRAYDDLADLAEHGPLRCAHGVAPVVTDVGYYVPRTGALEVFARIGAGDRLRAMAFRLELGRDRRWRCTAVELGGPRGPRREND